LDNLEDGLKMWLISKDFVYSFFAIIVLEVVWQMFFVSTRTTLFFRAYKLSDTYSYHKNTFIITC